MYVNLDTLDRSTEMYTAFLAVKDGDKYRPSDEIDFVAAPSLGGFAAQTAAYDADDFTRGDYVSVAQGGDMVVVGVVNQSGGYVAYDGRSSYDLVIEPD